MTARVIHMSTEEVSALLHDIERQLAQWHDDFSALHLLKETVQQIWESPATAEFTLRFHLALADMGQEVDHLQANHRLAWQEFAEWEQMDARFANGRPLTIVSGAVAGSAATSSITALAQKVCQGRDDKAFCEDLYPNWSPPSSDSDHDGSCCKQVWSHAPRNAAELAYLIQSLPDDMPIAIIPIGNQEYLVLLKGTSGNAGVGHNWGSAVESFFTNDSSYQLSVLAALAALPRGAHLHLAGHSQGGMVAMNLSSDPRLAAMGLEVDSVTAFGSPDTWLKANPDVTYTLFENRGDVIPKFDEIAEGGIKAAEVGSHHSPLPHLLLEMAHHRAKVRLNDVEHLATIHRFGTPLEKETIQTLTASLQARLEHVNLSHPEEVSRAVESALIDVKDLLRKNHDYTFLQARQFLKEYKPPFQPSQWQQATTASTTIQSPLANLWNQFAGKHH